MERLLAQREVSRADRDFAGADAIKDELARRGVALDYNTLRWRCADGRTGELASWKAVRKARQKPARSLPASGTE